MKKTLSCILAAMMLAFGFASCAQKGGNEGNSQVESTQTESTNKEPSGNESAIGFVDSDLDMEIGQSIPVLL